jgi:hypothetical protein
VRRRRTADTDFEKFFRVRKQLLLRDLARLDVGQQRTLRFILTIFNTRFALQQTPGLAALDAEKNQLP